MVLAAIRIVGQVNLNEVFKETLHRLKLRKKLTCVFIDEKDEIQMGMLKSVRNFVAFGEVDKKLQDEIIAKRGQMDVKGEFRGFCRLHPPIGGFKKSTKSNYPKGVLGDNKEITKLLKRML